jgi:hypothetical protein
VSPFGLARLAGESVAKSGINRYVNRMQATGSEEEANWLKEYLFQIFMRPGSTEFAIFIQFDLGMHAHQPLAAPYKLNNPNLPFPISFVFGQRDWMDNRDADLILKTNQFHATGQS